MATTVEIQNEDGIVWVHDPLKFRYLRESNRFTTQRRRFPVKRKDVLIVGYATHHKKGHGRTVYNRRFWYLKKWDRDLEPDGPYAVKNFRYGPMPCEAVIPESIEAGKDSVDYYGSALWNEDFDERKKIEDGGLE